MSLDGRYIRVVVATFFLLDSPASLAGGESNAIEISPFPLCAVPDPHHSGNLCPEPSTERCKAAAPSCRRLTTIIPSRASVFHRGLSLTFPVCRLTLVKDFSWERIIIAGPVRSGGRAGVGACRLSEAGDGRLRRSSRGTVRYSRSKKQFIDGLGWILRESVEALGAGRT